MTQKVLISHPGNFDPYVPPLPLHKFNNSRGERESYNTGQFDQHLTDDCEIRRNPRDTETKDEELVSMSSYVSIVKQSKSEAVN